MKKVNKILIGTVSLVTIILVVYGIIILNNEKTDNIENIGEKTITIGVYDKEGNNIYDKSLKTDKQYLIDVLKDDEELKVKTEDSEYGAFITSINGIEQGDDYYWSYYIDDEYAQSGISSCEVEENKSYNFKIEKFEY